MERKLLAGIAAGLISASAGAQMAPWNIQGNDAAINSDQRSDWHKDKALDHLSNADYNNRAATANAAIGSAAESSANSALSTAQEQQAAAQSYASQADGYRASAQAALNQDPPDQAAADAYNAQADAAQQQADYYHREAQKNFAQAQSLQQQAQRNLQESSNNKKEKKRQMDLAKKNKKEAQRWLDTSGEQTTAANSNNDALANAVGDRYSKSSIDGAVARMGTKLPEAANPMYQPDEMLPVESPEGDALDAAANGHAQTAMGLDATSREMKAQGEHELMIASESEAKAKEYFAKAAAAPTAVAASAWRSLAQASQQKADQARKKGEKMIQAAERLKESAERHAAIGVGLGEQAGQVKSEAASDNGQQYTHNELEKISAQTGVPLPPPAAPLYSTTPPDYAAINAPLTQESALAQNQAASVTGQASSTQSISEMAGEMGVQVPIAVGSGD